jgi:hypothetical protein
MGLLRGKIRWNIPGAGTAWSVLHFGTTSLGTPVQADADAAVARMQAWATSVKSLLPNVVSLNVQGETEEINEGTGALIGVWTSTTPTTQTGTAAAGQGWAAAAGAVVSWSTPSVRNNRRVRGRTFVVPVSNEVWDVDGTLKAVPLGTLNSAAAALRGGSTATQFGIWARPTAPGATDGEVWPVSGHRIPDFSAILRSRRA